MPLPILHKDGRAQIVHWAKHAYGLPNMIAAAAGGFATCWLMAAQGTRGTDCALGQKAYGVSVGHACLLLLLAALPRAC